MLGLALLLCGQGLAEDIGGSASYFPESEAFVGTWCMDDYILEIDHMEEDYSLFYCVVSQYNDDGKTGTRWIYDGCAYDDIGKALSSEEIGHKFIFVMDENDNVQENELVYNDGAASFAIDESGRLIWTDFKETPGENELAFERSVEQEPAE